MIVDQISEENFLISLTALFSLLNFIEVSTYNDFQSHHAEHRVSSVCIYINPCELSQLKLLLQTLSSNNSGRDSVYSIREVSEGFMFAINTTEIRLMTVHASLDV